MNIKYHHKRYEDNIIVSIEEFNREFRYVIFDFFDSNEILKFDPDNNDLSLSANEGFMVKLNNYWGKSLQENTYYSLSHEIVRSWFDENLINTDVDSFLINYEINLPVEYNQNIFGTSISLNEEDEFQLGLLGYSGNYKMINDFGLSGKLKVNIRNVGQANWNEILVDDMYKVIYDIGAPTNHKKSELKKLIGKRGKEYQKSKPILILSHWDKDHYHGLLGMTDKEIQSFQYFIFRNKVPNLTSRLIRGRLLRILGNGRLIGIDAIPKSSKKSTYQLSPINNTACQLVIYNSEENKNRNVSGLFVSLKSAKSSVVFSGDGKYDQVSKFILPFLNYPHNHSLIVPHHGGSAGRFEYKASPNINLNRAIISVGINRYGHPTNSVITSLKTEFKNIEQTRYRLNDIVINM